MSTTSERAGKLIEFFSKLRPFKQVLEDIHLRDLASLQTHPKIPGPVSWTRESQEQRLSFIKNEKQVDLDFLSGKTPIDNPEQFRGNIENFIGMTQVPTGVVGPLLINGVSASGDFYVPMATTEGALVASYNRGARATRMSGGITSVCLTEAVQRAPIFKFNNLSEVGAFMYWMLDKLPAFRDIVSGQSRFAKLEDMRLNMEGNQVIIIFEFTTGDAAGQNMATLSTQAICNYILENTPVTPLVWYVESNYSGDKKATVVSFSTVRGKKVTAEALIRKEVVKEVLSCNPEAVAAYWQSSTVATIQSGSIGAQGHFANGLTALFLACGQDVACVAEAFVGITRMETTSNGDLYVAVTLPSLVVGTVGGGTRLPTQQDCLRLLGCEGLGTARKFAEICGATVLAGELSIAASLATGSFSKAHKIFGRQK